ncbi:MAG: CAP domain-containing protein [Candidatus Auribacter fodinae]|uniref:CAP domain-containing protein n=1 Tax=Candidatus Auribacter fodinae TaxID=2093366 RepID=A0A3A4R704_9BACT|nr:MAG: CAP domain-containing protein [Candidatus Auribacter fodinae]
MRLRQISTMVFVGSMMSLLCCGVMSEQHDANDIARDIMHETNKYRLMHDLKPLEWDPALADMAQRHSSDMVDRNFFSHVTPDGKTMRDRAVELGLYSETSQQIAENIGMITPGILTNKNVYVPDTPGGIAFTQVALWVQSPGHRLNMLNPDYKFIGVGVRFDGVRYYYITQVFR